MQVKLNQFLNVLTHLVPYDVMVSAFSDAEVLLSNDVVFRFAVKCLSSSRCFITKLKIVIKYDYVNDLIFKVFLEIYLSPELTVGTFFGDLSKLVSRFKGDFELSRDVVKVVFSIPVSKLDVIFEVINSLKDALKSDFQLISEGYEVLAYSEG